MQLVHLELRISPRIFEKICQRHRCSWCILSCEFLREFSKKFETALTVYSRAWEKLIQKKPEVENLVALSLYVYCSGVHRILCNLGTYKLYWSRNTEDLFTDLYGYQRKVVSATSVYITCFDRKLKQVIPPPPPSLSSAAVFPNLIHNMFRPWNKEDNMERTCIQTVTLS